MSNRPTLFSAIRRTLSANALAAAIIAVVLVAMVGATLGATYIDQQRQEARVADVPTVGSAFTPTAQTTAITRRATPRAGTLPAGNDWTQYRFDVSGTGVNPEGRITAANASRLTSHWTQSEVAGFHPFESTPAELDGVIYITAGNSLHAMSLSTGKELWHFDDIDQSYSTINSSVAIDPASRIAYYGTPDARVYAVSLKTHLAVWNVQLGDPTTGAFIWSSPLLIHGNVYIGLASHDDNPCVRGGIFALNAGTGAMAWTHYTVPDGVIGGSVWSSLTADPSKHELIATTGNPCPDNNVVAEEDSIIALDWDTGATLWQYQALTYDDCDCDFGEGAVIYTYQNTQYMVAGSKYGRVYALTPPTSPDAGPQLAWSVDISGSNPNDFGEGGIFEPATYADGIVYIAGGPTLDGTCPEGAMWALKGDTGDVVWKQCTAGQVASPATLSGGALFVGQHDKLVAYDALTGNVLWQASLHVDGQPPDVWGGVTIARGYVLVGTVSGYLHCYSLSGG
jgi:outer membrane protein assembly factor BamB